MDQPSTSNHKTSPRMYFEKSEAHVLSRSVHWAILCVQGREGRPHALGDDEKWKS